MKAVTVSELKAKLSRYLRLVKNGQELEVRDRGNPIAKVIAIENRDSVEITHPLKSPKEIRKLKFTVHPKKIFDIMQILLEDRK